MGSRGAEFIFEVGGDGEVGALRTEAGELAGECSDLFGGLSVTESFHQSFYPARFEILRPHGSQDLPLPGFEDLEEEKKPHVERSFRGASSFAVSRAPLRLDPLSHLDLQCACAHARRCTHPQHSDAFGDHPFRLRDRAGKAFSVLRFPVGECLFFLQFSRSGEV